MEELNFIPFIAEILENYRFDWFVTLGFIPSSHAARREWVPIWEFTDPQNLSGWTRTPGTAAGCLQKWLEDIQVGPNFAGPGVRNYMFFEERRFHGEIRYHVLIANFGGFVHPWERHWKEISGGWARTREIDLERGLVGLLGYYVMRAGYRMTAHRGGFTRSYTQADFRPWRPKYK